jgi:hypothetical protein
MHDAVQLQVLFHHGHVVEEQHRDPGRREVLLERQQLAAVAQGALRQEADLGEAVEDDAGWVEPPDLLEDGAGGLAELEVGGVEQALLLVGVEQPLGREQLEQLDPVE